MTDTRTLREKLHAMASQDVSPHEAAIAAAKLADMGAGDREPPRTRVAAPFGGTPEEPWPGFTVLRQPWSFTTNTSSSSGHLNITFGSVP